MRLEVGGWAGPPCGEQLCPPPESNGELPEFERPEQISVVNHFLQPLGRSETWVRGEKEAEERCRWEMMEWKEAVELERQWFGEVKLELGLMWAAGREMGDRASWFLVEGEPPGQSGPRSQGWGKVVGTEAAPLVFPIHSFASHLLFAPSLPLVHFRSGTAAQIWTKYHDPLVSSFRNKEERSPREGVGFPRTTQ